MVRFAEFTREEQRIIDAIVDRALSMGIYDDRRSVEMDLSAVHCHCPLRLAELRDADNFNFGHDMRGILRHINRTTGELGNFFLPRFAA